VTILLDTHALLWFLAGDEKLSSKALSTIEDPSTCKVVSIASAWEIVIKASLKRVDFGESAATFLQRELHTNGFEVLPIELSHVTRIEDLPMYHRDPFDRLLVAQSLVEGLPIVSVDGAFDRYGVSRIW
jgi:PIN domain nuclease of toxin-antitoxin system